MVCCIRSLISAHFLTVREKHRSSSSHSTKDGGGGSSSSHRSKDGSSHKSSHSKSKERSSSTHKEGGHSASSHKSSQSKVAGSHGSKEAPSGGDKAKVEKAVGFAVKSVTFTAGNVTAEGKVKPLKPQLAKLSLKPSALKPPSGIKPLVGKSSVGGKPSGPPKNPLALAKKRKLDFGAELANADANVPLSKKSRSNSTASTGSVSSGLSTPGPATPNLNKPIKAARTVTPKKKATSGLAKKKGTPKKQQQPILDSEQIVKMLHPRRDVPHMARGEGKGGKPAHMVQEMDYLLRNTCGSALAGKFSHLIHIEESPNGGASVVHSYMDELDKLSPADMQEFIRDYFSVVWAEEPYGAAKHVMGVVHGAAAKQPDFIEYFAINHPELVVKKGVMANAKEVKC